MSALFAKSHNQTSPGICYFDSFLKTEIISHNKMILKHLKMSKDFINIAFSTLIKKVVSFGKNTPHV